MTLEEKIKTSIEWVGNLNEWYDQALCRSYGRIADFYQKKTYRGRADLVTASFITAFAAAGTSFAYTGQPLDGVNACFAGALALIMPSLRDKTNNFSSTRFPTTPFLEILSLISPAILTVGAITAVKAVAKFTEGYITQNQSYYFAGIEPLLGGINTLGVTSGLYFLRSSPGDPPPRRKKKPLSERVKEGIEKLLPKPVAEPVPVKVTGYGRTAGTVC